jgi:3',5'-cyclic AMP phosphodiesterase CpdA
MKVLPKLQLLLIILGLVVAWQPQQAYALKVGVITDIHAGHAKIRDYHKFTPRNIIYPRQYKPYLSKVIKNFQSQGVEAIVLNGDATSSDSLKYAQQVKKMVNSVGIENFWVAGNHEGKKIIRTYFTQGNYYFTDRSGWRLIFLDSSTSGKPATMGGVDQVQMDWLRATIADAPGSVVVFMHHPLFMLRSGIPDGLYAGYADLENIFSESGKVKYVISGHVHTLNQYTRTLNGVEYITNTPLTLKGRLGSYQIIDLPSPPTD